jgi:hypothetical protein
MRPQTRPFMVETKSRNRTRQPAISTSFTRQDDWLDLVPPDDLPERDVNEDLGIAPTHNQAFREAEKVFARIGNTSEPVEANDAPLAPVTIAEPARRVLPDLLAAAREEERVNIQLPKTKRTSTRKPAQRRTKTDYQPVNAVPAPEVEQKALPIEVPTGHAEAAIARSRRNPGRSKLPPGQRWKERRLPKVCWGRKRPRT